MFAWVTGSISKVDSLSIGGGFSPALVTDDIKPAEWRARESRRCRFVEGMEVRPSRAFEAFWRWEQTWERETRDMVRTDGLGIDLEARVGARLVCLELESFCGKNQKRLRRLLVGFI